MLDIKFIRENPEKVKQAIKNKNVKGVNVNVVLKLDKERRQLLQQVEKLRGEQNRVGRQITEVRSDSRKAVIDEMKIIKGKISNLEDKLRKTEEKFRIQMSLIPNIPFDDVPLGQSAQDNQVLRQWGKKPKFDFKPKDYLTLAEKWDWIDVARAGKTSGSRFGFIKGELAKLEFKIVNFVFEKLTDEEFIKRLVKSVGTGRDLSLQNRPFIPIVPPVMLNKKSMMAMGYLDRGEDEVYYLPKDELYLVGTSEQSIGAMHQDEVFAEKDLPRRYVGFSTCFRREAGSYGKDTKGILRVHQFDKLEMFSFCRPEDSQAEHFLLLALEEALMQEIGLPYQVVNICTADLGDPAARKYDIEVWLAGQGQYRETHSTSNCTDFQARRLNIRYRNKAGKLQLVHTLNGTAFALGRTLIALIENYQQKDGTVVFPKILGE